MAKILFLSGGYYPETTPNGVCLRMVALQLLRQGHEVHIVCQGEHEGTAEDCIHEGIHLHYIKPNLFLRLRRYGESNPQKLSGRISYVVAMLLNKLQKVLLLPWYPLNHPYSLNLFYQRAVKLQDENHFDRIIGLYCPLEATYAAVKLKNKFSSLKVGVYVLDSLIYMPGASYFPRRIANWLQWRMESKVYRGVDMVFNMRCHEIHHRAPKYDCFRQKIHFLDIPLFVPRQVHEPMEEPLFDRSRLQLIYMGTLFKNYREPYYLCRLASDLNSEFSIQIHFYTRGSCEAELSEMAKNSADIIQQHGYVSHSLVETIYANADFLVNIGVNSSTMISSKIFDYMAYGKPIIHFYYQDDDVNNKYLNEYPLCCMIQMKDELYEMNKEKLRKFLSAAKGKTIDAHFLLEKFKENIPEYTANAFVTF